MELDDQRVGPEQLRLQGPQAEERVRGPLQGAVKPRRHRRRLVGGGDGSVVMAMVRATAGTGDKKGCPEKKTLFDRAGWQANIR